MAITGLNPLGTSFASGSFSTDSSGYTHGIMEADPAARYAITAGKIKQTDKNIYFGGMPIVENVSEMRGNPLPYIQLATASDTPIGFTVFNQANNLFILGANQVPTTTGGGTINYVRFGSNARVALTCDPALRFSLNQPVSTLKVAWDFDKNQLVAAGSGTALPVKVLSLSLQNSKTVQFNQDTQIISWNPNGSCALVLL
ncbi:hypothetical protein [Commensalibacter nepenthis]|uniref:Uncharacterized protein n=1 Tax=Commensalibacter nepenthis TaxID=3043872 RepID=A0ABT6Q827_9PROT|nr:hypothetical protein [Commensalibacter sp. TBRC 10068]MDI2113063.1 hypothetical protein [Commensalibacter sp. TBRC 10068]